MDTKRTWIQTTLYSGLGCLALLAGTGCQVDVGGQTLPSPYYLTDDVQYYSEGPEFKLQREATAMEALTAEAEAQQGL
ncbi:hypothetical protein [Blastopirellula marina]|uniref:Uncharacterized protein n=1 Tax=Blastopirellula marina TaxID=124 RepID=A0A2S8GDF0_9BACT|nr:hypothetical protein [Blastopirellula marina]PQO42271.1 hypothetical protein C5Y93_28435 [Blastopirellula marina]